MTRVPRLVRTITVRVLTSMFPQTAGLGWLLLAATGCAQNAQPNHPTSRPWSDPDHLYTVGVAREPTPRDVQELNGIGTINYKVYKIEAEPYTYRVAALVYPGPIPGMAFDPQDELGHASGKSVARMRGTIASDQNVVENAELFGKDLIFSVEDGGHRGRGILRVFITRARPFVRFEALCIAPADADFEPCTAFVRSLHPTARH